jgi:hypothetical protein
MEFAGFLPKRTLTAAVIAASAVGLSGCFDLGQKVALHRDGSGTYEIAISANGVVGKGLARKDADIDIGDGDLEGKTRIDRHGDLVTRSTEVAFHDFSDLKLGDETLSLHVNGKKDDFSEVNFHRSFRIDHARRHREDDDHIGRDVLETMFDGHSYTFSVWLPGKIEHIAPLRVGGRTVSPTVWGDAYGHTLIWKMQLADMLLADHLDFDVDFAAQGEFRDVQSLPGVHHIGNHHHHDDDEDDDDGDDRGSDRS